MVIITVHDLRIRPYHESGWILETRSPSKWRAYRYPHSLHHGLTLMFEELCRCMTRLHQICRTEHLGDFPRS